MTSKLGQLIARFACNEIDQDAFLHEFQGIDEPPPGESPTPRGTAGDPCPRQHTPSLRGMHAAARIRRL